LIQRQDRLAVFKKKRRNWRRSKLRCKVGTNVHLRISASDYSLDDDVESHLEKNWIAGVIQALPPKARTALAFFPGGYHKFDLTKNGTALVSLKYKTPAVPVSAFDVTPFAEDEDFDFLLFVHNVLSDPERRRDIWDSA
jgi:hypothetical protein